MSDLQLNAQDEVLLESLVLAASDNVTRAESEDRGEYAPTRRRVYEEIDTGNVYLGTGDAWVDVSEATGLVSSLFQGGDINVADVDADSVNAINAGVKSLSTKKADITNETLIEAFADSGVTSLSATNFTSPSYGIVDKDELGEFSNDGFTPNETGYYTISCYAKSDTTEGKDGDQIGARLRNTTDGNTVLLTGDKLLGAAEDFYFFPPIALSAVELTAGKKYEYQVVNRNSQFGINGDDGIFNVRSAYR